MYLVINHLFNFLEYLRFEDREECRFFEKATFRKVIFYQCFLNMVTTAFPIEENFSPSITRIPEVIPS